MKLISINIERDVHYARVRPFLEREMAGEASGVVCMQEVFEHQVADFAASAGMGFYHHVPMMVTQPPYSIGVLGVALLSKEPLQNVRFFPYGGNGSGRDPFINGTTEEKFNSSRYSLLMGETMVDGEPFRIATTHFLWTPGGHADDYQRISLDAMMEIVAREQPGVLCGDFNAPRGREIFTRMAGLMVDNIPPHYTTSLDGNLHRAGPLPYMVDGLFSPEGGRFDFRNVALVDGVSDHMAIVAEVVAR